MKLAHAAVDRVLSRQDIPLVNHLVSRAVAGEVVTEVVEGNRRIPVLVRYPESARSDAEALGRLQITTPTGHRIFLADVTDIRETARACEIEMIEKHAPAAASDLGTVKPDVLVFGCTSAGSLFGLDYDAKVGASLGDLSRFGFDAVMLTYFAAIVVGQWKGRQDLVPWLCAAAVAAALVEPATIGRTLRFGGGAQPIAEALAAASDAR